MESFCWFGHVCWIHSQSRHTDPKFVGSFFKFLHTFPTALKVQALVGPHKDLDTSVPKPCQQWFHWEFLASGPSHNSMGEVPRAHACHEFSFTVTEMVGTTVLSSIMSNLLQNGIKTKNLVHRRVEAFLANPVCFSH